MLTGDAHKHDKCDVMAYLQRPNAVCVAGDDRCSVCGRVCRVASAQEARRIVTSSTSNASAWICKVLNF